MNGIKRRQGESCSSVTGLLEEVNWFEEENLLLNQIKKNKQNSGVI